MTNSFFTLNQLKKTGPVYPLSSKKIMQDNYTTL